MAPEIEPRNTDLICELNKAMPTIRALVCRGIMPKDVLQNAKEEREILQGTKTRTPKPDYYNYERSDGTSVYLTNPGQIGIVR